MSAWASVAAALVASGPWSARAEDATPASEVSIEVVLIYGSPEKGKIDAELVDVHESLLRFPMRFGTLQRKDTKHFTLPLGQSAGLDLPKGAVFRFLPIAIVDGHLHMHLQMPGVNTRLQVTNGRPVIMSGPRYENGVILVEVKATFDATAPAAAPSGNENLDPAIPRSGGSRVVQQPNAPASRTPEVQRVGTER